MERIRKRIEHHKKYEKARSGHKWKKDIINPDNSINNNDINSCDGDTDVDDRREILVAWTMNKIFLTAFLFRVLLICYGPIHDYLFDVSFTDVDYKVFSDAAMYVRQGASPYRRATYRYTPLLAWILLPNTVWPEFGKLLFCLFDIVVAYLCYQMITSSLFSLEHSSNVIRSETLNRAKQCIIVFWLANPLTAIISTRGNADVLVCAAVIYTLKLINDKQWLLAAVSHGLLAVQLKIYPVIYMPSIFLCISNVRLASGYWDYCRRFLLNWKGFVFVLISTSSFTASVIVYYYFYGAPYLNESLLYHLKRIDTRHNFSPYFYPLYLSQYDNMVSQLIGRFAFFPQAFLLVILSFRFYKDLAFCWMILTMVFVTFNKVCTSQYFIWFVCLIPIAQRTVEQRINTEFDMVFYLIGLGLGDVEDITVKGLKAVRQSSRIYLEAYTSILSYALDKSKLENFYGKELIIADREFVEQRSDELLLDADKSDVCLLVVGDPFGATTHSDLVIRARNLNIPVKVIHNASIMNAVACCGLQLYNFGETVSIVMWTDSWQPDSYYDKITANRARGLHTLCLLDIKVKEQSVENLIKGRKIYEPPRYMSCSEAAKQLLTIAERKKKLGIQTGSKFYNRFQIFIFPSLLLFFPPVNIDDCPCIHILPKLVALDWRELVGMIKRLITYTVASYFQILFCSLSEMSKTDMGDPLHSLVIPAERLHPMELEMLKCFSLANHSIACSSDT
ncbi:unnamed protein product [Anisakis simplex]|uniref:GPI alpha-1,4-mannosyltransferase I, catalytic subunit n=1 Tax=Anisakis simplex TaxID=6269 RepID=A0A0M3JVR0_ANISI|nr:unnamed protein product [Anisakis simplex]